MDAGLIGGLAICSKNKLTIRRMGTLARLGFVACSSHRREDRTGKSAHPTVAIFGFVPQRSQRCS